MNRWITADDIIEIYAKLHQRGLAFLFSKFGTNPQQRTLTAFNDTNIQGANWWQIDLVRQRWNSIITGNPYYKFEDFIVDRFLVDALDLKMLSIGCGNGTHELNFAKNNCFRSIIGYDISDKLIEQANQNVQLQQLSNIQFVAGDIFEANIEPQSLDVVMFYSSLHHFDKIDTFLSRVKKWMKQGGLIIIHEYVGPNRLIISNQQAEVATNWLQSIPRAYRKRFKTGLIKNRITGPGLWRMLLSDPSEAVDSTSIMPQLHKHFDAIYEAQFGTVMMMLVLKDIAHHFTEHNHNALSILNRLFEEEDKWMKNHQAHFVFGVYRAT
jgi:ubiquinone/menaquinone biosynthesis C-methylase UbiE